jgi:hypothetical protein
MHREAGSGSRRKPEQSVSIPNKPVDSAGLSDREPIKAVNGLIRRLRPSAHAVG